MTPEKKKLAGYGKSLGPSWSVTIRRERTGNSEAWKVMVYDTATGAAHHFANRTESLVILDAIEGLESRFPSLREVGPAVDPAD